MIKDRNFKFGKHASRESPVMTPENFFKKGAWPGSRDSVNFCALNANSSKMSKGTSFQFGKHVPRDSLVMTLKNFGGAKFAGPENVGPQKNNDWKLQHLENDGPNRSPGNCKTWKMTDQISPLEFARPGK